MTDKGIDKRLQAYRIYKRFIRILLTICGCSYSSTKSKSTNYSVYVLLMMILYAILNVHMCYFHRHNLPIMMKCIGITISTFGAILKVGTFLTNHNYLTSHHEMLDDLFEEELVRNEKIRMIMFLSLPTTCFLAFTYSAIIIACMLAFYMPTYLLIIHDLCHLNLRTANYTLPVTKGYGYFWTVPNNFLYYFHLLYETNTISFSCLTACGMDSAFGFYVYQFSSTMRAMTFRIMNPPPTEKFSDVLKACVVKHQKLLPYRDMLEHMYGPIVFWHIVTNAVLLCALIYEMSSSFSDFNIASSFVSLTYAAIKLLQTFMYAWYGTVLTDAFEDFRNGVYFGEWHNYRLDHHVRTNIVMIMMQKPMTINAFFSSVDMIMFTNVSI
ncbi:hypothetical protein PUN28_016972 [Cardiocondyla obscurior]|uniref:Odorant receptor n=1 Tax=Cardiocondyla obscurior TaxID=286306 RepID=A0AAW2EP26_9HYME